VDVGGCGCVGGWVGGCVDVDMGVSVCLSVCLSHLFLISAEFLILT
jgi:hypothetical protein